MKQFIFDKVIKKFFKREFFRMEDYAKEITYQNIVNNYRNNKETIWESPWESLAYTIDIKEVNRKK